MVFAILPLITFLIMPMATSLPSSVPSLHKRVFACPVGTLVCCHITHLHTSHTAQGCLFPSLPFPFLYLGLSKGLLAEFLTKGTFVTSAFEASACQSVLGGLGCCEEVVSCRVWRGRWKKCGLMWRIGWDCFCEGVCGAGGRGLRERGVGEG